MYIAIYMDTPNTICFCSNADFFKINKTSNIYAALHLSTLNSNHNDGHKWKFLLFIVKVSTYCGNHSCWGQSIMAAVRDSNLVLSCWSLGSRSHLCWLQAGGINLPSLNTETYAAIMKGFLSQFSRTGNVSTTESFASGTHLPDKGCFWRRGTNVSMSKKGEVSPITGMYSFCILEQTLAHVQVQSGGFASPEVRKGNKTAVFRMPLQAFSLCVPFTYLDLCCTILATCGYSYLN